MLKNTLAFLMVFGLLTIAGCSSDYALKWKAEAYIANLLNDPDSAKFRNIRVLHGGTVCGEVNGKNGYGAYAGFTKFVWSATSDSMAKIMKQSDDSYVAIDSYGAIEGIKQTTGSWAELVTTLAFAQCAAAE